MNSTTSHHRKQAAGEMFLLGLFVFLVGLTCFLFGRSFIVYEGVALILGVLYIPLGLIAMVNAVAIYRELHS